MTPERLRERVPLFAEARALELMPLADGVSHNNTNYKVWADGTAYFLRVPGTAAPFLGVQRDEELAALRAAGAQGLAPEVLFAAPDGLLVLPFLAGGHWTPAEAARPENIVRLAQTLRRLHDIREVAAHCSVYERIERLIASATQLGQALPDNLPALLAWMATLRQQRATDPRASVGLCHGDFWLHNFLDDGKQLWLIDWEFAGRGDGLVDLAKITIGGSSYTPAHQQALLHAYGYTEPGDLTLLDEQKTLLLLFQAVWALVLHGLRGPESAFDYLAHSQQTFRQINRALSL
ncbi:phosphotransferase [Armatimonas rosea]|uniref:Thiamine kinase-like enzyme n=1 Tax=Armatimonas rosea TaxID=685828 RepID=A0A7W9SP08_ARMRO|nr:thiamine kinase-like enzyme [Armatimonas rosea]